MGENYKVNFDKIRGCFNLELGCQEKYSKANDICEECPICFDVFQENTDVIKLTCNHIYHKECISNWFQVTRSCPKCRANFDNNKFIGITFVFNDLTQEYINIDESQYDHFTQILFMLKESFYNVQTEKIEWDTFTKDYITNLCNDDEDIYLEWPDGTDYVNDFPDKVNYFIHNYCDVM